MVIKSYYKTCRYGYRNVTSNTGIQTLLNLLLNTVVFDLFVCGEVLRPSLPSGVMWSMVSLPNHTFTGQA